MIGRLARALSHPNAAFAIFALAIPLALLLPTYPDEVAFRIYLERFFILDGARQSLTVYCQSAHIMAVPAALTPAAVIWSGLSILGTGWWSYRLVPLACLLGMLWLVRRQGSLALMLPLVFGPLLYGLIILRPEGIVAAAGLGLFLIFREALRPGTAWRLLGLLALALLVFDLIAYMHPKALYMGALMLAGIGLSAWTRPRLAERLAIAGIGAAAVLAIAGSAAMLISTQWMTCPENPSRLAEMHGQSVNPMDLVRAPGAFLAGLGKAFSPSLWAGGLAKIGFTGEYDIGYLQSAEIGWFSMAVNTLIFALVFACLLYAVAKPVLALRRDRALWREIVLMAMLALGFLAHVVMSLTKHWYEASYLVAMIAIIAALAWPLPGDERFERFKRPFQAALALCAILSLGLALKHFTLPQVVGQEGPGVSVLTDRAAIAAGIGKAGIPPGAGVLIDDATYAPLRRQPRVAPLHYTAFSRAQPEIMAAGLARFGITHGALRCEAMTWFGRFQPLEELSRFAIPALPFAKPKEICVFRLKL